MKPLGNKILVTPDEPKQNGVIVTIIDEKINTGVVASIGSEVKEVPVGARVIFNLAYDEIILEGKTYFVMYEDDILGILHEN